MIYPLVYYHLTFSNYKFHLREKLRKSKMEIKGAWITDIDDTLIKSGETPNNSFINWLSQKIEILGKHDIYWVPMTGVAMVKLGPRILYRLPKNILSNVIYYAGDGSQKYFFSKETQNWEEDISFRRIFSDAQTLSILGEKEFKKFLTESKDPKWKERIAKAKKLLKEKKLPIQGIIEEMKNVLKKNGFNPNNSETYFRGGSVSWMMLGDTSAELYKNPKAAKLRSDLIQYAKHLLRNRGYLRSVGPAGIIIPFPGARGIKFVLEGNTKERAVKDINSKYGISFNRMLFTGNELFEGGNDNVLRKLKEITLLSTGEYEDEGENIVRGRIKLDKAMLSNDDIAPSMVLVGEEATRLWMEWATNRLKLGYRWEEILHIIKTIGSSIFGINEKITEENGNKTLVKPRRLKKLSHDGIDTILFDEESIFYSRKIFPLHKKNNPGSKPLNIIRELYFRGYRLGIIHNSVDKTVVPEKIEKEGIAQFLEIVVPFNSSYRNSNFAILSKTISNMNLKLEKCAYVTVPTNTPNSTTALQKMNFNRLIIISEDKLTQISKPIHHPDVTTIKDLENLLEIFT